MTDVTTGFANNHERDIRAGCRHAPSRWGHGLKDFPGPLFIDDRKVEL